MSTGKGKIIAIVCICVLCVALIVVIAVSVARHREETLLKVCWENTVARYVNGAEVNNGSCERPEELVWKDEQIPLRVVTVDNDWEAIEITDPSRQSVQAALLDSNLQLGFLMFSTANSVMEASVVVQFGIPTIVGDSNPIASATHHRVGNRMVCFVRVDSNVWSSRVEYLIAHHELLHCAGLAHDNDNEQSAMYPMTVDDSFHQLRAARITDKDRATLRRLYKKGEAADGGIPDDELWSVD